MKKVFEFLSLGLLGIALVSCGKSESNVDNNTYTVTFNSNDPDLNDQISPSVIDSVSVKAGTVINLFDYVPTYLGYTFNRWATNQVGSRKVDSDYTVTKDITLYAVWDQALVFSINYNNGEDIVSSTVKSGDSVSKPTITPTKASKSINGVDIISYEFSDWYQDENLTTKFDFTSPLTKNTTIYAGYNSKRIGFAYKTNKNFVSTNTVLAQASDNTLANLSVDSGFAQGGVTDFANYVGTSSYREVSNADELAKAINDAKYNYKNSWENNNLTQTLTSEGSVHVIEIKNDIDLAYNSLTTTAKGYGTLVWWDQKKTPQTLKNSGYTMTDIATNGITKIKVEGISNLLIYSKNGSKITHAGFSLLSCQNVCIRNIEMDEIYQWEDASNASSSKVGDYDLFGWAYGKISFSTGIWFDHCKFGKSYDGQIDVSNGSYSTNVASGEWFRAPYDGDNGTGVSITFCEFNAHSDDYYADTLSDETKNSYLYQMMSKIETDYINGGKNYLYYNALRDAGFSFTQILEGIAAPQKKGFLLGDDGQINNKYLKISFNYCDFNNIEDRLFKCRGAMVTSTNCRFDSVNYYNARLQMYDGTTNKAKNAVKTVNSSSWNCGMVSQAILLSEGASFYAGNNYYSGIIKKQLIRNNDNDGTSAGIKLNNVIYNDGTQNLNVTEDNRLEFSDAGNSITLANFSYNEYGDTLPFKLYVEESWDIAQSVLDNQVYGCGTNKEMQDLFLISSYIK